MKALTGAELREAFLAFFEGKGHRRLPSASLVPGDDPTLLFTGAGMNQFKDMFLGRGTLPWRRVCTAQKCLRVGDLERVGRTASHHTLFEMLGNFSFGDYFKRECVAWEWEFFTAVCGIPPDRMVVTIYEDDDEAEAAWREGVGIPASRIYRFGEKENFWPAEAPSKGPDGPCGPCSEIYFDLAPGQPLPADAGLAELPAARFVEIGNCVFTQFDRRPDGTLAPLPQKNIDVGLGLERIVAVLAGVRSNFQTDLFRPYLAELERRTGRRLGEEPAADVRLRRIADHLRGLVFAVADGVAPGNEGRGYVVRKILRRAARDGFHLGLTAPFLHELAPLVAEVMGSAYPEVPAALDRVCRTLKSEEEGFHLVFRRGLEILDEELRRLPPGGVLSGRAAFQLHDTHGFPFDTAADEARERGYQVDEEGFQRLMEEQRDRSRKGSALSGAVFAAAPEKELAARVRTPTVFTGYERDREGATVVALLAGGKHLESASAGTRVLFATDRTPYYAAAGGQLGDRGLFLGEGGLQGRIEETTACDGVTIHHGLVEAGELRVGAFLSLEIDARRRRATERNHTATHLLHAALREVLGPHVQQAGSLVEPERLRFDFTHPERIEAPLLRRVEETVNREILRALEVIAREMSLEEAREAGFTALFGEKYGDRVRGISVGESSRELCGGTHARNSGALGLLVITSEGSVAAGVRRLEAVTGEGAMAWFREREELLARLAARLKTPLPALEGRLGALLEETQRLRQELDRQRSAGTVDRLAAVEAAGRDVDGIRLICWHGADLTGEDLTSLADRLRERHADLVALLASADPEGKAALVAAASGRALARGAHAGRILGRLAEALGGGGGGKPVFARGQGRDASRLEESMAALSRALVQELHGEG